MKCVCCDADLKPESLAAKYHLCFDCTMNIGKGYLTCHKNQVPLILARAEGAKREANA